MSVAQEPPLVSDPAEVERRYAFYQPRILLWTITGYAMFYFVRKNLSVAMPVMGEQLGISKANLGIFLTLHGLLYGLSKFVNGVIGDRVNARLFMAFGLVMSAVMNICFGFSSAVVTLGIFWMINGWFQGIGFPPCARLLTHWFSPKELSTKMSLWNTSHAIGACAVLVLCGQIVKYTHDWRMCFFIPAGLAIATAGLLMIYLRDTPSSVGLPEVAGTSEPDAPPEEAPENFRAFLIEKVFCNKWIWIISLANFFVYTIRYAVLDWGPTMLKESKGITLTNAAWMIAAFEAAGAVGMVTSGWATDKYFRGRGARTCVICMILCGVSIFLFWYTPRGNWLLSLTTLMATGFFMYGPQGLVGTHIANLATKRAAATAVGLSGIFGYASTILSGWGLGALVDRYGWQYAFGALLATAVIATIIFLLAWPAPRDGYAT